MEVIILVQNVLQDIIVQEVQQEHNVLQIHTVQQAQAKLQLAQMRHLLLVLTQLAIVLAKQVIMEVIILVQNVLQDIIVHDTHKCFHEYFLDMASAYIWRRNVG